MSNFYQSMQIDIREIRQEVKDIRHELHRYKGFMGGALWALTGIFAALQLGVQWLIKS